MNKKTSLADIGETLDSLHYESKALNWKHYKLNEHHNQLPKEPFKKYNAEQFKWSGRLLHDQDPLTPLFIDDPSQLDKLHEQDADKYQAIVEEVKWNDEERDYSYNALSKDEKTEIALFHSMK